MILTIIINKEYSQNTFVSVMFRLVATILLLAAFSVQVFNRAIVMADYYVNITAYIEKCENKAAPEMNCEGKCQASKKMKDEEKKEQNSERKGSSNEVVCSKSVYSPLRSLNKPLVRLFNKYFCPCASANFCSEIFHPPAGGVN